MKPKRSRRERVIIAVVYIAVSDRRESEQGYGRGETRRIEPGGVVDISLASRPYACVRLEIVVVVDLLCY